MLIDAADLNDFVTAVLEAVGVAADDARTTSEVLVEADLRGHESHGVSRLHEFYVRPIQAGQIDPGARLAVLHSTAATLCLDAANGLGQPAGRRAMEMCIARARQAGMCLATVRHSNHFGIAGYYAMLALPHDMIGIASTNSTPLVVPTGGSTVMLGTNPIAIAAPAERHQAFVLDMATSVVPAGKVEVKARRGEPLPAGWAVDGTGQPTTDARAVLQAIYARRPGGLMPLGGAQAGHKGYGLAAMVDVLCGVLAGAGAGMAVGMEDAPADVGHFFAAIDLAAFGSANAIEQSMDAYIEALHASPHAAGVERILVAGEPEFETAELRRREGIPLHPAVAESLRLLGAEFGVPLSMR